MFQTPHNGRKLTRPFVREMEFDTIRTTCDSWH